MDVLQSFKKTVRRFQLFDKTDKLLIAVSGGADSIALCHICHALGYEFGIAHINYQLRGEDSEGDAAFVESKATEWNIPFHSQTIDCKVFTLANNLSIQEAARNIRYDFFDAVLAMHDYDYVLTAHHAKDNVETMLYTLAKGATLTALRGIPLKRNRIVRPLLYTTKTALDLYLRKNDINHRHDISNDDTKYNRNYIRHEILPRLEQLNPNLEATLANTSMLGAGYQDLLVTLLKEQKQHFVQSKKLDLSEMKSEGSRYAWLYEMIHPHGFNFNDALDIWSAMDLEHSTGKTFESANNQLTIDRGSLVLSNSKSETANKQVLIYSVDSASDDSDNRVLLTVLKSVPKSQGAYFDMDEIKFPLTLRRWQPGDRFRPSGMKGKSKKVKAYLTDQKISGPAKAEVEVLLSQGEIIWVVGHRLAHGFKAISQSTSILSIAVK